jgi:hypothetical protein
MTVTVEVLRERVEALEREVADLRQVLRRPKADETPAERGARLLREAKANQPAISAAIAKAFAEMGITGEPVGHEKLRQMMLEEGIKPEENLFSSEIKAMREE